MEISPVHPKHGSSLVERIGSTPLVRIEQAVRGLEGIILLAKAEWANPGGSVKDRAAASMVADARLRPWSPALKLPQRKVRRGARRSS
jgi:hypothetical protein